MMADKGCRGDLTSLIKADHPLENTGMKDLLFPSAQWGWSTQSKT